MRIKSVVALMLVTTMLTGCGKGTSKTRPRMQEVLAEITEENERISTTSATSSTTEPTTTQVTTRTTTATSATTTIAFLTTTAVTTETEPTTEPETEPIEPEQSVETEASSVEEPDVSTTGAPGELIYSGMRGTYYAPGKWNGYSAVGGSGRSLLDCNSGGDGYAKGSIASKYLYNLLGYYANDGRTAVWLSVDGYPDMEGIYYLDDCSGANVIDFYYNANSNCQFCYAGVVSVDIYYVN